VVADEVPGDVVKDDTHLRGGTRVRTGRAIEENLRINSGLAIEVHRQPTNTASVTSWRLGLKMQPNSTQAIATGRFQLQSQLVSGRRMQDYGYTF
jgi:hypothetical protein